MTNRLISFDPVGSFQQAKANKLAIDAAKRQAENAPVRNQLLQAQLAGTQANNALLDQRQQLGQMQIDETEQARDIRKTLGLVAEMEPFVMGGDKEGALGVLKKT